MPRPSRSVRPLVVVAVVVLVATATAVVVIGGRVGDTAPVRTENVVVDVAAGPGGASGPGGADPVSLDATLYLPERTPAPAVLVAHGFGGSKDTVREDAEELARRGYTVLAWSARGFGASTGEIALNSPDYEVADASALLDWLAERDEVVLDAPGDPRVGATGGSYGGGLALLLAGYDRRVDAIAPVITWNDLGQALFPNAATRDTVASTTPVPGAFAPDGVFKRDWAGALFSAGAAPGDVNQAPLAGESDGCGRFRPEVCAAYAEAAVSGVPGPEITELLRRSSPATVADRITAPTLLVQGEQDTLFGLDQADATARALAEAGTPVSVRWFAGGHDGGDTGVGEVREQVGSWFDRYLRDADTDDEPGFGYQVQGTFTTADFGQREVTAPNYPGLAGTQPVQRRAMPLTGPAQPVLRPPGANPAAVSGLPGLGGPAAAALTEVGGVATDLPGQVAVFDTAPLAEPLDIAGAATVRLRVSSTTGATEAVLFGKLYDVGPDGSRVLPGAAVAPMRIAVAPDGSPAEVEVTLAGVVRPVAAGHTLQLAVATTDRAYSTPVDPAGFTVEAISELSVPVIPGEQTPPPLPVTPLLGLGALALLVGAVCVAAVLRRRRASDHDPASARVPLVIEGLTKRYPTGLTAVDDLSFRVEHGQVLGLLGPNGAGKTTTLRMLMGLIAPTEGTIRVFGHVVTPGAPVLSRIGSFVEGSGFLPHLSGYENLRLYWAATGRADVDSHLDDALEIAGLGDAVHRRVGTYSQGMRQRLAIAQAMLGLPDLLVLDEPTNGLDPPQIHAMREVLRGYAAGGRTVLVSSHLLAEVEQTCGHVVVMHRGRLVAEGPVEEIVAGGGQITVRVDDAERAVTALRDVDGLASVTAEPGAVHVDLDATPRSVVVAALVRADVAVSGVGPRRRLEDAFLQLVGDGPTTSPGENR